MKDPYSEGTAAGIAAAGFFGEVLNAHPLSVAYRSAWQTWCWSIGVHAGHLGYKALDADGIAFFQAARKAADDLLRETYPSDAVPRTT